MDRKIENKTIGTKILVGWPCMIIYTSNLLGLMNTLIKLAMQTDGVKL
jgi:hypothetical protein